jgi:hypothetical protein
MVSKRSTKIEMSVGGVQKISLWKKAIIEGKEVWEEVPNLPKSFLQKYLDRGFVLTPPDPEPVAEKLVQTFSEAVESGTLSEPEPVPAPRKRRRRKQKV